MGRFKQLIDLAWNTFQDEPYLNQGDQFGATQLGQSIETAHREPFAGKKKFRGGYVVYVPTHLQNRGIG